VASPGARDQHRLEATVRHRRECAGPDGRSLTQWLMEYQTKRKVWLGAIAEKYLQRRGMAVSSPVLLGHGACPYFRLPMA
jgi:hypothetical protein